MEEENPFEQENVETKDMHTVLDLQEKKSTVNKSIVQVMREIFIILHFKHIFIQLLFNVLTLAYPSLTKLKLILNLSPGWLGRRAAPHVAMEHEYEEEFVQKL